MALNISIFEIPLPIFLAALVLMVVAIVVLTVVEIKMGRKAKAKKEFEETYYQRKLSAAAALQSDQNGFLISLDKVAREFFSEEAGLSFVGKYSQLIEVFNKKQMFNEATFCQKMQEALYSGEKMDQNFLYSLHSEMKGFVLRKEKREMKEGKSVQGVITPAVVQTVQLQREELNPNILRYMKEGLIRGFNASELREKLVAKGFDEAEIIKVEKHLGQKANEPILEQRMPVSTEKRILTNFFNPKNRDLEIIKKGVEEKDEIGRAEIIEVIPYKKEEISKKELKYPEEEPERYKQIGSLDNLERVKKKIDSRKEGVIAG
jgi:hypothetical protein